MARLTSNAVLDSALQYIEDNTDTIWIIASASTTDTYDDVKVSVLASVAVASTIFTLQDGAVSGRRQTIAIISGVSVAASGTARHICFVNVSASTLHHMTETSAQVLAAGNTVNTSQFSIEIEDPTA